MHKTLRILSIYLTVVGLAVALYLYFAEISLVPLGCGLSSCDVVNSSKWAYIIGLPVSVLGALYYGLVLSLLILNKIKLFLYSAIIGSIFSLYLTGIEMFVLKAFCQWCLLSAWITWALLVIALRIFHIHRKSLVDLNTIK